VPEGTRAAIEAAGPVRYDIRLLSELLKRLGVAECVQWENRKEPLGLPDWHYLAREDTGSMFEICAALGARSQQLRRFGRLLGMVYHGCDDVADVRGAKNLGGGGKEDLEDGILTLPAALAIRDDEEVRNLFCVHDKNKPRPPAVAQRLLEAYQRKLPEAEAELDRIAALARDEARDAARAPEILVSLVDSVRGLSR
jgi:geranylgeranyl pyrophosphate synthase